MVQCRFYDFDRRVHSRLDQTRLDQTRMNESIHSKCYPQIKRRRIFLINQMEYWISTLLPLFLLLFLLLLVMPIRFAISIDCRHRFRHRHVLVVRIDNKLTMIHSDLKRRCIPDRDACMTIVGTSSYLQISFANICDPIRPGV